MFHIIHLKSQKTLEQENLRLLNENINLSKEKVCFVDMLHKNKKEIKALKNQIKKHEKEIKRLKYILKVEKSFG